MSTATMTLTNTQTLRSPAQIATIYLKEAKYEFLKTCACVCIRRRC